MPHYLLVGAGFSRNWGGWLADEVFEYLLGSPEVAADPDLRGRLWRAHGAGGFEAALADLQAGYATDRRAFEGPLLALQAAVAGMFGAMNESFMAMNDWQFGQRSRERQIGTFLPRFDAIFSLNQDLLLEHHYANDNVALNSRNQWIGPDLPGMRRLPPADPMYAQSWARSTWIPTEGAVFTAAARCQPIYKLHGSSNWLREDGSRVMIIGGAKARAIEQTPILRWYAEEFDRLLAIPEAKLMVIGYGFRDEHINAGLARAVERGLKLFIVAPEGAELVKRLNPTRAPGQIAEPTPLEGMIEESLIGASRRGLREIFGHYEAEFAKVMRFFAN